MVFHHAGGNSRNYYGLFRSFLDDAELYLADLPGRMDPEEKIDLSYYLEKLSLELAPLLDTNTLIFGHSMGCLVATEFARLLSNQGNKNIELILSGFNVKKTLKEITLSQKPDGELKSTLEQLGAIPQEVQNNVAFYNFYLDIIRRDFKFIEEYNFLPTPLLDNQAHLFIPINDPFASVAGQEYWENYFTQPVTLSYFEGSHFYLFEKQEQVVDKIKNILERFNYD